MTLERLEWLLCSWGGGVLGYIIGITLFFGGIVVFYLVIVISQPAEMF